jgi:pimeloyl-ACP methyl ester carboxylesterase
MAPSATEAYRERLNGRWGEVDVADCVAAARALVADGWADAHRLAITRRQRRRLHHALRVDLPRGVPGRGQPLRRERSRGARQGDPQVREPLSRSPGRAWPEAAALYRPRSPIHHVERLSCPIIFFQGLEDAVVPPNQAELMVEALRRKRPAGRVPHLRRRAARLSQGRDHPDPCCAPSSRSTDASSASRRPTASRI